MQAATLQCDKYHLSTSFLSDYARLRTTGVLLSDPIQNDVRHTVSERGDFVTQSKPDRESSVGITCGFTMVGFISVTGEGKTWDSFQLQIIL